MTPSNSHPATFASWHLPAIAFFVLGLLAGVAFAVTGPSSPFARSAEWR